MQHTHTYDNIVGKRRKRDRNACYAVSLKCYAYAAKDFKTEIKIQQCKQSMMLITRSHSLCLFFSWFLLEMSKIYTPLLLCAFGLSLVCCELTFSAGTGSGNNNVAAGRRNTLLTDVDNEMHSFNDVDPSNYDKRVERYAFGLGRRAYTYNNVGAGVKRLPVYNFGLGKRARPYSFGLGKRAEYDEEQLDSEPDHNSYNLAFMDDKRNRPYSFGLGKRDPTTLEDVDRRGYPNRYGFGLGRR